MKIEEILIKASELGASDIHMSPGSPLMFRIDGRLVPQFSQTLSHDVIREKIWPIIPVAMIPTLEEEGEIDFAFSISGFSRVRVNIFRQRGTYAVALRILSYEIPKAKVLKIPEQVIGLTKKSRGLILVTGATGTGKSTTIASLLDIIANRDAKNIITIEDPIEYLHAHRKSIVSQRELGTDTKGYAKSLRSALRQDPDVVFIGELKDVDTIETAITAAETGHLVFSTLHTTTVMDTIKRLVDIFPPYQQQQIRVQLAGVLKGIITQQLIPKLDNTGRIAVFEVLLSNDEVKAKIRDNCIHEIPEMLERYRTNGMQSMDQAITDAFMKSAITAEAAISAAIDGEEMTKKVF